MAFSRWISVLCCIVPTCYLAIRIPPSFIYSLKVRYYHITRRVRAHQRQVGSWKISTCNNVYWTIAIGTLVERKNSYRKWRRKEGHCGYSSHKLALLYYLITLSEWSDIVVSDSGMLFPPEHVSGLRWRTRGALLLMMAFPPKYENRQILGFFWRASELSKCRFSVDQQPLPIV